MHFKVYKLYLYLNIDLLYNASLHRYLNLNQLYFYIHSLVIFFLFYLLKI